MVENMQRKIVAVMVFGLMMPFYMQAMTMDENTARALGVIGTVTSLGAAMALLPNAQEHVGGIVAAGALFGGISYLYLREHIREHIPAQIEKRGNGIISEMQQTNLLNLIANDENSKSVEKVMGAYGSLGFFENSSKDIDKYKPLLLYHLSQFKKAKLSMNTLQMYYDRLENISRTLPECVEPMTKILTIQKQITKYKKIDVMIENHKWEMYLNIVKWSYPTLIKSGLALSFFAWIYTEPRY